MIPLSIHAVLWRLFTAIMAFYSNVPCKRQGQQEKRA